jgi:hypothetical protein
MKITRLAALAAMSCCALMLLVAGPAAAQSAPPKFTQKVNVTGTKGFKGTYTIERFVRSGNRAVAVGTMKGRLRGRSVRKENVRIPVSLVNTQTGQTKQVPPTSGACQILNLVLNPIDLNLLGLRVRLNQVALLIEAVPSAGAGVPGGLLGDLVCGITNLLNPGANTPLGQLVQLLNALLALVPRGPAA